MENFKRWLMKTNARVVFVCSLLALLVAIGYWTWLLIKPIGVEIPLPTRISNKSLASLGLLGFVNQQLSPDAYALPDNSFLTPGTPERVYHRIDQPPVKPPPIKPPPVKPPPVKPPPIKPPSIKPPPAPPVTITYMGIFKKTDGRKVAWIKDSRTKSRAFYDIGDDIFGATLENITATSVQIRHPDGTTTELLFGKSVPIKRR